MATNTTTTTLTNLFADKNIARTYSQIERATGPPAHALIRQAGLLPSSGSSDAKYEVLDNACGMGVVTMALYEAFKGNEGQLKVVCGDLSAQMVQSTKERIARLEGLDAEARELNGQAMDIPSDRFTHVLTNFGFQSFSEAHLGLRESIRVAKPGGTIGMTNWVKPGWVPALRRAVSSIPGAPTSLPDPLPFMIHSGRWFEASWTRQQLEAIQEVDPASIQIDEHSFTLALNDEGVIRAFIGLLMPVFTLKWSEEEKKACGEGRLAEAVVQAIIQEPNLVFESLITTVRKRA